MTDTYSRHLRFGSVTNFRDIGGYRTRNGYTVAWRRVFRSGEFARITRDDFNRLMTEIGPISLLDLRSKLEVEKQGIGLLSEAGLKYHHIALMADDGGDRKEDERRFREFKNMGEFYLDLVLKMEYGRRIVEALEVIAGPGSYPLVFNCAVGKDRTGILAAVLLSVLGVTDEDIIEDYSLSGPYMEEIRKYIKTDPHGADAGALPEYFWKASPDSMELFLNTLRRDYGSIEGYLEFMGGGSSLVERLRTALLG